MIRKLSIVAVLIFVFAPATASAYWPYAGWGYGGYGNGWGYGVTSDYVPSPPYFAVHPPVYYSPYITARHYGASPFAWPAGMSPITYVARSEQATVEPQLIENPYVGGAKAASKSAPAEAAEPVAIVNPFVNR
jgi:hypothetical protein